MTSDKKRLMVAIAAAVFAWLVGTWLVGVADEQYLTAAGVVNMSDPFAIERAIKDQTFTATLSWGSITLQGLYWSFAFPLGLAVGAFVLFLGIGHARSKRADNP